MNKFCSKCGAKLIVRKEPDGFGFNTDTGEREEYYRIITVCPNATGFLWKLSGHDFHTDYTNPGHVTDY